MLFRTGRDYALAIRLLRRYVSSPNTVEEAPAFKAHSLLGELLEKQGDRAGCRRGIPSGPGDGPQLPPRARRLKARGALAGSSPFFLKGQTRGAQLSR